MDGFVFRMRVLWETKLYMDRLGLEGLGGING